MGWGVGGMLTFVELATLQIAMLHRCVVDCIFVDFVEMVGSVGKSKNVLHEWVAQSRGEFEKTVHRGMEKISCHTGTIDATWSAVKDFIPNWSCSKSKHLLLYVKCWQWRYVNLHARLQQKNMSTLKGLL